MKKRLLPVLLALLAAGLFGCAKQDEPETTEQIHQHDYTVTVVEPSCEEEGYTLHECSCGDSFITEETPALGHDYAASRAEPNCLEGGGFRYTCTRCQDSYLEQTSPPLGHSYEVSGVVEPEGETRGYTEHRCVRCGDCYQDTFTWTPEALSEDLADAAFLGDSMTYMLFSHNQEEKYLSTATFLYQGGVSIGSLVSHSRVLYFQGKECNVEDAVKACGARKLFILLGINDLGWSGVDGTLSNLKIMLDRIEAVNPGIQFFLQSVTPTYTTAKDKGERNEEIDEFNARLQDFAEEYGCHYVDIATPLKDERGALPLKYCWDLDVHLNSDGCRIWANTIKSYIYEEKYICGTLD